MRTSGVSRWEERDSATEMTECLDASTIPLSLPTLCLAATRCLENGPMQTGGLNGGNPLITRVVLRYPEFNFTRADTTRAAHDCCPLCVGSCSPGHFCRRAHSEEPRSGVGSHPHTRGGH